MLEATRAFRGMAAWDAAMAASTLTVLPKKLRCDFEGGAIEMPMDELQVECGTFVDDQVIGESILEPGRILRLGDICLKYEAPPRARIYVRQVDNQASPATFTETSTAAKQVQSPCYHNPQSGCRATTLLFACSSSSASASGTA